MNELKPEDVMRAMELCGKGGLCVGASCPYFCRNATVCIASLQQDALALLREKDAEIERLNKASDAMVTEHNRLITLTRTDIIYKFADRLIARAREIYPVDLCDSDILDIAYELGGYRDNL